MCRSYFPDCTLAAAIPAMVAPGATTFTRTLIPLLCQNLRRMHQRCFRRGVIQARRERRDSAAWWQAAQRLPALLGPPSLRRILSLATRGRHNWIRERREGTHDRGPEKRRSRGRPGKIAAPADWGPKSGRPPRDKSVRTSGAPKSPATSAMARPNSCSIEHAKPWARSRFAAIANHKLSAFTRQQRHGSCSQSAAASGNNHRLARQSVCSGKSNRNCRYAAA